MSKTVMKEIDSVSAGSLATETHRIPDIDQVLAFPPFREELEQADDRYPRWLFSRSIEWEVNLFWGELHAIVVYKNIYTGQEHPFCFAFLFDDNGEIVMV